MKKIIFLFVVFMGIEAKANISIYPYHLDFDTASRTRVQSIRVINKSDKRQTYRVSVVDLTQDSQGNMTEVDSAKHSAKKYLQFSPRQFTLEPNLVQTINIAQRGLGNAPNDEFFSFVQISETKLGERPTQNDGEKKLSIQLVPLFSVRFPVKILNGKDLVSNTDISSFSFDKENLNVLLKRTGNISSHVDVALLNDKKEEVGRLNSVKIYPPNDKLKVQIPLKKEGFKGDGVLKLENAVSKKQILTKSVHK